MSDAADCFAVIEQRFADWHYDHPKILYGLIRSLKPSVVVEVGAYRGYCACYMARALQENGGGHLYCIDSWQLPDHAARYGDPRQHWEENLTAAGVREWATLLEGDSCDVEWPERVDFAYVDGSHAYRTCRHDVEWCIERGATCIAIDDIYNVVGPHMVFAEMRQREGWDCLGIHRDAGLGICIRREPSPDIRHSQELPGSVSADLHLMSEAERRSHFDEARRVTGLDYREFVK